ncbi:Ig-like domain-containing protein [Novipirellula artificiosorum]|uniref:Beta-hexosaminidase bacterial type N-terminal domain-containing protein n=1 Tax=Novipirellula artificiosorum TaxID=2528016 RepID=A0A5C6DVC7_9BACT|nr:Ig-like domain-containing protein [Novipirellula artificiosorum]TWU40650.1 hypothetical protein Poly41_14840 [Novipirellula artificiosorum]
MSRPFTHRTPICRFATALLLVAHCAFTAAVAASVEHDAKNPQLAFAARELEGAMKEAGQDDLQVTLSIQADASSPEAFQIRSAGPNRVEVIGSDSPGAMYGGLEIADRLRLKLPIQDQAGKPFIAKRGIKFNIPLDARTPSYDDTGDSAQNNIETMWDFEFWKAYLDDLARYRYNVLTFWSTHPFPSLIKLEEYPEIAMDDVYRVAVPLQPSFKNKLQDIDQNGDGHLSLEHDAKVLKLVKTMTIDEKIAHWQRVFQYANDRGIEIHWFCWNIFTFGATGHYGITEDQTNPITVEYTRQCVRQLLLTYPQIAGIGVTAGENSDRSTKGEHATENFIFNTFGRGIMDARKGQPGRQVRFIFRRHVTERDAVMDAFKGYTGGILDTSTKYAVAHMYSSRRPQEWETRIVAEGWPEHFKTWLNLRNDDIVMQRWGSPDFVREFIKWMPREHSPGFYMGSDGYVWARESVAKNPEMAGRLEVDKHWYQFRLWGQLAYNTDLGRDYWEATLAHRFPGVDAKALYDAWESVSEIVPQVNRAVWAPTDGDFAAEACAQRDGFLGVDDFHFARKPMVLTRVKDAPDPQCVSVTDWAKAVLSKKPVKGLTPLQVADNLDGFAATAQSALTALRQNANGNVELLETLNDIESMAFLGRYYADKTRGAAKLALFRESNRESKPFHAEAVAHFQDAVEEWRQYARVLTPQYKTQLLARTHFLDWNATLKEVENELAKVESEGDFPEVQFTNPTDGAQLAANSDLRVEVQASDRDGIKEVKLYLNGLLLDADKKARPAYAWSGSSDDLLKGLKTGVHQLAAVAEDMTGVKARQEIQISVGDVAKNAEANWKDEIHQVLLKDGDRMMAGDRIDLPRLECKVMFNTSGKLVVIDQNTGLLWGSFSKDEDDLSHFAEFKNGQFVTWRGTPEKPEVALWKSREQPEPGDHRLAITVGKRLIIYRETEGKLRTVVWMSPEPN